MLEEIDAGHFQPAIEKLVAHAKALEARIVELEEKAAGAVKKAAKKAETKAEEVKTEVENEA